ncbi:MAG: hypothetical protein KC994_24190 [Candidatus Omnitrophica bacterium]|nr:hypothetical protein [Candidatus Omnitrophota bacterium]
MAKTFIEKLLTPSIHPCLEPHQVGFRTKTVGAASSRESQKRVNALSSRLEAAPTMDRESL